MFSLNILVRLIYVRIMTKLTYEMENAYEMEKYLISEKEQIKCNNVITQHKK